MQEEPTQEELAAMDLADETLKIKDDMLLALGKEIKQTEEELERRISEDEADWAQLQRPMYQHQISTIQAQMTALETQIKNNYEADASLRYEEHGATDDLTVEYKACQDVLEDTKRRVLFPNSKHVLGGDGVYFAFDDFWIEFASGSFDVKLVPGESPNIIIRGAGKDDDPADPKTKSGIKLRFKADRFRLAGDKGMGVPKLRFNELKLTLEVTVDVTLTFEERVGLKNNANASSSSSSSSESGEWKLPGRDFQVKLLDLKAPFGITRTLGNTILTLVRPLIRRAIIDALPIEVGLILRSLPSNTHVKGNFDVTGTYLRALTSPLVGSAQYSEMACAAAGLNNLQAQMFQLMQKYSMGRAYPLKTLSTVIQYRSRFYLRYPSLWEHVLGLWDRAVDRYNILVNQRRAAKGRSAAITRQERFSFAELLRQCDSALQKPLDISFNLINLTAEFNVNKGMMHIYSLMKRLAEQTAAEGGPLAAAAATLSRTLGNNLQGGLEVLNMLKSNLDDAQALVRGSFHAGLDSQFNFCASNIRARMPVMLFVPLPTKIMLGRRSPVEFIITISPQPSGDIQISMDHMISDELERILSAKDLGNGGEKDADGANAGMESSQSSIQQSFVSSSLSSSSSSLSKGHKRSGSYGLQTQPSEEAMMSNLDLNAPGPTIGGIRSLRLSRAAVQLLLGSKTFFGIRGGNAEREHKAQEMEEEQELRSRRAYLSGDLTVKTGIVGGSPVRNASSLASDRTAMNHEDNDDGGKMHAEEAEDHPDKSKKVAGDARRKALGLDLETALEEEVARRREQKREESLNQQEWRRKHDSRTSRVLLVTVSSPKVSLVADREAFIRADQELFTLSVQCTDDSASGSASGTVESTTNTLKDIKSSMSTTSSTSSGHGGGSTDPKNPVTTMNTAVVNLRTLTGVRLLAELGKVVGSIDLPRLQLFAADLYQDLPLLKEFLEKVLDCKIDDELIEVGATILDLSKKYILRAGFDLDFNALASIRSESGDIVAAIATPRGTLSTNDPMSNAYLRDGPLSRSVYGPNAASNGVLLVSPHTYSDGTKSESDTASLSEGDRGEKERSSTSASVAAAGGTDASASTPGAETGKPMFALRLRAKFLITDLFSDVMLVQSAITRAAHVMERRNKSKGV